MEQGRLASCHMFGAPSENMSALFPYGIYTIPEISMVGQTEEKLTAAKVPYEVGIAKYAELAKSMMLGDESGMLKLLFDRNTRKLWASMQSASAPRKLSTSAKRCLPTAARSNIFAIRCSTIPRLLKRTRWRRSTGSTSCNW